MDPIPANNIVTENGDYETRSFGGGSIASIEWEITAGTATVVPGVVTPSGVFREFQLPDGTSPTYQDGGDMATMDVPSSGKLALRVTDAAGLEMTVASFQKQTWTSALS